MRIAYQNQDCEKIQAGKWENCDGCIFRKNLSKRLCLCDLIPSIKKCAGLDLYVQTGELSDIFI